MMRLREPSINGELAAAVAREGASTRSHISDYALIGNCETAALVDRQGSIDWLCWPRFDSDACLAALLGDRAHGHWQIAPSIPFKASRRYRPDTLILETRFETDQGVVILSDFMPPRSATSDIVRLVLGEAGVVPLRMTLVLRFGYGAVVPWVNRLPDGTLSATAGPSRVLLRTPIDHRGEDLTTVADFTVGAGRSVPFVLSHEASHLPLADPIDPAAALPATEAFWTGWLSQASVRGPYADAARRSLITLKALTYAPTGGIVAAPTTSLPEQPGGSRNWDYRFCWIRDSTLTLLALMNAGYRDEAAAWRDWLLRAVAGDPYDMQIMYGLGGERRLMEWTADWLPGHHGAAPVRIGNAAHRQFQLDVYGELMDTFHQAHRAGLPDSKVIWGLQRTLVDHVGKVWNQPDEGIWEVRGPRRHFTFSRVMAWVAVDRALKDAEALGEDGPIEDWRALRDAIAADVWTYGFDAKRNTFTQAYGETSLDASLLLLAQVGFVEADDPRYVGTVEAIERDLVVDGFVRRYHTGDHADGLPPGEGAFLACSFWLADAYAMIGRMDDAVRLFDRLLAIRNDVGLLAEEIDPCTGRFAGNFPQAFSHIGLLNTAANLTRGAQPNEQRKSDA